MVEKKKAAMWVSWPTKMDVYLSTISRSIDMLNDDDLLDVVLLVTNKAKNIKPNTVEQTRNRIKE